MVVFTLHLRQARLPGITLQQLPLDQILKGKIRKISGHKIRINDNHSAGAVGG